MAVIADAVGESVFGTVSTSSPGPSPIDFDHPLDYRAIDGEHDVFGDGTVILMPTYGHTPGHQSLLVRAGKGARLVCASDACYTQENMDRDVLPTILWDAGVMRDSLAALRKLRDSGGATIFYAVVGTLLGEGSWIDTETITIALVVALGAALLVLPAMRILAWTEGEPLGLRLPSRPRRRSSFGPGRGRRTTTTGLRR